MVIVDQLRISDNGKELYLDVRISEAVNPDSEGNKLFENVTLDKIVIKTADTVSETAPGYSEENCAFALSCHGQKSLSIILRPSDFNLSFKKTTFSEDLFFVFIKTAGAPSDSIPCRLDEPITTAVTFDETLLYQKVMNYTKELAKSCDTPSKEFIDFILQWNAFKASVETEHWCSAVKFYKMLFSGIDAKHNNKRCSCHG